MRDKPDFLAAAVVVLSCCAVLGCAALRHNAPADLNFSHSFHQQVALRSIPQEDSVRVALARLSHEGTYLMPPLAVWTQRTELALQTEESPGQAIGFLFWAAIIFGLLVAIRNR